MHEDALSKPIHVVWGILTSAKADFASVIAKDACNGPLAF